MPRSLPHQLQRLGLIGQGSGAAALGADVANTNAFGSAHDCEDTAGEPDHDNNCST